MFKRGLNFLKKELKYQIRNFIKPREITLYGVKIDLTLDVITPEIRKFIYNEGYEAQEISILDKVLEKDDRVMEIGAGIGFLSTFIAKRIGSDKVIAYEANPELIPVIQRIYQINKVSPIVKNCILSDREGKCEFYIEKHFWSSSTFRRSMNAKRILVKQVNINKEIKTFKPTFLIIDIEGGEKDLIPKISSWNGIRKVLIELHPHIIGEKECCLVVKQMLSVGFCLDLYKSKNSVCYFKRSS
jgi:FkbM family methyltransferase